MDPHRIAGLREQPCPYPRVIACKRPAYEIQYEQVGPHTFVHVIVSAWTPKTKDEFSRDINILHGMLDMPVFVLCDNAKLYKFCSMFGFKPICSVDGAAVILKRDNKKHGQ